MRTRSCASRQAWECAGSAAGGWAALPHHAGLVGLLLRLLYAVVQLRAAESPPGWARAVALPSCAGVAPDWAAASQHAQKVAVVATG